MNIKRVNDFFSYVYIATGIFKAFFILLLFLKMGTNIISIFNGGSWDYDNFDIVSNLIGFLQFFLLIGSIVMILLNIQRIPEVIPGYLYGLLPALIEIFVPSFIYLYIVLPNCGLYISAGYKIMRKNSDGRTIIKTSKKKIKNTDWFYRDDSKEKERKERDKVDAEKEIDEWKQLLDSGEIDEEIYKAEESRIQENLQRKMKDIKDIKENMIPILLGILICIILIGAIMFCLSALISNTEVVNNVPQNQIIEETTTKNIENTNNENDESNEIENTEVNNTKPVDMSKYYLDNTYGNMADIYNHMLDELGNKKCIIKTSNGSDSIREVIDLTQMYFLSEYSNFYECWGYTGIFIEKYKYYYDTGKVESNVEDAYYMEEESDFVDFAVSFDITDDNYTWDYEYNENVLRNGIPCYEIIGNWNGDFELHTTGEYNYFNGVDKLYIDMNTYDLIEKEITFTVDGSTYTTYSYFYEYQDARLELPEDAEEYMAKYR